tara:strand:- start:163 stop:534 length:372 start_codon:yes stop_codon:yes gene_type:complete
MDKSIYTIIVASIVMLILDSLYLSSIGTMFSNLVVNIQRTALMIKPIGVILCYLVLILGFYYFILKDKRSPMDAFLLGVFVYAVYELTNYATIKKWPVSLVLLDSVWGGVLFALTAMITYKLV